MKRAYLVSVVRTGCIPVLAENAAEAMRLADRQHTDDVNWSDDWVPTDAEQDNSIPANACFDEPAF